jgi:hypothetical protein
MVFSHKSFRIAIELLENFVWRIGKGDYVMRGTRVKGKYLNLYFHKFVAERMGLNIQGFLVDHINRNSLDNRRENLRLATFSLNNANSQKRSNNTTGYRGVYWIKQKQKWHSRIQVNNKTICLGTFNNSIDAAKAYDKASHKYFGDYGYLNFPV